VTYRIVPVAAHLAKGGILTELGVPIHDPVRIEFTHMKKWIQAGSRTLQ